MQVPVLLVLEEVWELQANLYPLLPTIKLQISL
jgi:hypothetical protein